MLKSLIWLSLGLMLGFGFCVSLLSYAHQGSLNPIHAWQNANKVVGILLSGEADAPAFPTAPDDSSALTGKRAPLIPLDATAIEEIEGIHLKDSPLLQPGVKPTSPPAEDIAILEEIEKLEQAERNARSAQQSIPDGGL